MNANSKTAVCNAVYRQFPEVKGASPSVKQLPADKYQLMFQGKVTTEDGKSMSRTVRVVADDTGRILKMTTSR
ncbi:MAG TPA: hypothetical protein PK040_02510 [Anaerolineaceae bacterium]|nr:hypothetical protein [Anaerolineaceae bacterium]